MKKMVLEQIAFGAIILAGGAAAYTDWKTGYIYDWITLPLIGIGIILSVLQHQWIGFLLGGAIYAIGIFAYNSGKMGGGDIKLLTGIALVQPVYQGTIFVLAVLLIAALAACAALGAFYVGGYLLTRPKITWNTTRKRTAGLLVLVILAYVFVSWQNGIASLYMNLALGLSLLIGVAFYAFEDEIKTHFFLKYVKLNELEDDEVVALEHLNPEEKKRFGKSVPGILGREDRLMLQHMGFDTLPVYRNLPKFAPFLFAGILLAYLFPPLFVGIVPTLL